MELLTTYQYINITMLYGLELWYFKIRFFDIQKEIALKNSRKEHICRIEN